MKNQIKLAGLALCISLNLTSVKAQSENDEILNPPKLQDGIEVGTVSEMGLKEGLLKQLSKDIDNDVYKNIHSVLVLKDNKLIYEKYGEDYTREDLHTIRSVSKFITATVLGIAIDNGDIKSKEDGIFEYLPEFQKYRNEKNEKIQLQHLVTMTGGLEWRESDVLYGTDENDETQMYRRENWIEYVLEKPVKFAPGEKWEYSGGLANLTGVIIKNAVGQTVDSYANDHLFKPLGINQYVWRGNQRYNWVSAAAGLQITPRDMAKIGLTFLNGGVWNGKRIISKEWVKNSGTNQIPTDQHAQIGPFTLGYGYCTLVIEKAPDFMPNLRGYASTGNGGQILWVLPEDNAVVIMTGGNFNSPLSQTQPMEMMIKYIYPTIGH